MTTIQNQTNTSSLTAFGQQSTGSTTSAQQNQDRFLTLLVTQLKNQDPMNPLDNAQVTSQLAQISTVEGIQDLNKSLQALAGRFDGLQTLQGAAMVGRQVLIEGNSMDLTQGAGRAAFELDQSVDSVTVSIKDANGQEIRTIELGRQSDGVHELVWDGLTNASEPAADGRYQFTINVKSAGEPVEAIALMRARVDGVSNGVDGVTLSLAGYGEVSLGQVKRII